MFTLTPPASEQIVRAAAEQPDSGGQQLPMLRVAAKHDEKDGELVYGMGFDEEREDDLVLDGSGGIAILISPHSQPLLESTTLDFAEVQPGEFQFIFRSGCTVPTAEKSCGGCGGGCS